MLALLISLGSAKLRPGNRQDWHHVVQGEKIHVHIGWAIATELCFCLDVGHHAWHVTYIAVTSQNPYPTHPTSVSNLDALWHPGRSTAEPWLLQHSATFLLSENRRTLKTDPCHAEALIKGHIARRG